MPQIIKLKRSAIAGQEPTIAQLELGEVAINTNDGRVFFKKDDGNAVVYELNTRQNQGIFDKFMDFQTTDAIKLPVGGTGQRPTGANLITGAVRYNSDDLTFEGYDGANWGSLGGVKDVDQDTYITPESAPNADEDTLTFYGGPNNTSSGTESTAGNLGSWNKTMFTTNTDSTFNGDVTMNADVTLGDAAADTILVKGTADFEQAANFQQGITVPAGAGTSTFSDGLTIATGQTFTFAGQALTTLANFQVKNEGGTVIFNGFVFKP